MKPYLFLLMPTLWCMNVVAQVNHKEHEIDIIGDFRVLNDSKVYGFRAGYTLFNFSDKIYSYPIQLYTGVDYSTNTTWNYSFGIRFLGWRRNLDKTAYMVHDTHLRTGRRLSENFRKEEHITAFGLGYKLKNDLGIEYLIGGHEYDSILIHNFAIAKTFHFQNSKKLFKKQKIQDCPIE